MRTLKLQTDGFLSHAIANFLTIISYTKPSFIRLLALHWSFPVLRIDQRFNEGRVLDLYITYFVNNDYLTTKGLRTKRRSSPCIFQIVESLSIRNFLVLFSLSTLAQTVRVIFAWPNTIVSSSQCDQNVPLSFHCFENPTVLHAIQS